jgi:Transposase DDE domain
VTHLGYLVSQRLRMRVEEIFGWWKTVAGGRKLRYIGRRKNQLWAELTSTAFSLVRLANLSTQATQRRAGRPYWDPAKSGRRRPDLAWNTALQPSPNGHWSSVRVNPARYPPGRSFFSTLLERQGPNNPDASDAAAAHSAGDQGQQKVTNARRSGMRRQLAES